MFRLLIVTMMITAFQTHAQIAPQNLNCDAPLITTGTPIKPQFLKLAEIATATYVQNCKDIKASKDLDIADIKVRNEVIFNEARYAVIETFGKMANYFNVYWNTEYTITKMGNNEVIQISDHNLNINANRQIALSLGTKNASVFSVADSNACDSICKNDIKQLIEILRHSTKPVDNLSLTLSKMTVQDMNLAWVSFLEEARPQTFLDVAVNSAFYRYFNADDVDQYFTLPPSYQLFFLHPGAVIENVAGALDGEQVTEAVILEVFGINYWEGAKACFGYPCGASFIVSYKDRGVLDDKGWGVMVHINNAFSIGYNKYGSEDGVFISVDLLELLKDTKKDFNNWKSTVGL